MTIAIQQDMTLEDVITYIETELNIDDSNLGNEATRQVKIFSGFQRLHMLQTRKLEKLMNQLEIVKNARIRHYTGKMPGEHYKKEPLREAVLKSEVDQWLKIDSQLVEMKGLVNEQERIVKAIEEGKKQLSDRGYLIKNAIDFVKMSMGM